MADNVAITAGSGTSISTDEVTTLNGSTVTAVQVQRVKPVYGADGTATDVSTSNPLPVSDAGGSLTVDGTVAISGTVAVTDNSGTLSIDDGAGSITVDGTVSAAQSGTWTVQPGNTANTTAWKVDGSAVTQPVSSATLATAAKQPALGTAGSASTDVITVQGIASGVAQPASQSGTWTVQPGNTANTTAWKVDGSAVTQPVSSATFATAAKQPALGTAGSASADVISIQGVASMTAVKVDGSAVTQPVSGTVTAQRDTVSTATLANVSSSATSVTLFSSNASAKGRAIWNNSTQVLYVKWGTTAAATDCVVKIAADGYYEFPAPLYYGRVDGIWASANGAARVTEW